MAQTATQIATDSVAAIVSSTSAATNFNIGSLIRSIIDADAAESAVQEQQIEDQVAQAINNALAQALGMAPVDATGSVYMEQFSLDASATQSRTLPAGTAVTIPGSTLQWVTGQSITIAPGQTVNTTVSCTSTGVITNVPANSITQLVVPVPGITVTNPSSQPIVPGQDAGTAVQVQAQLSNKTAKLQRGVPKSIEAAAVESQITDASGNPVEQVVKAMYIDATTAGEGYCYVFNGIGPMSQDLLTQTQNIVNGYIDTNGNEVEGYKPAGGFVYVTDAPQTSVTVSVAVILAYGYTLDAVQTGVQDAIQQFFDELDLGEALSLQLLGNAITAVPGVKDVNILSPATSLPAIPYVANPTTGPTLTAVTVTPSTNLAAGTYTVGYTFTNPWGETELSPTATVTIAAGQAIQVSPLTLPVGATGANYYLSSAGGTSVTFDISGPGGQINLTVEPSADAASPPSSNTAQIQGNAYVLSGTPNIQEAAS
ncbi:MAG: baseplate J/gp47 family protein [Alicyclobacillus sp.]|nr:baseplate J/gp47 family protein [Alicyclobacillus sp.]